MNERETIEERQTMNGTHHSRSRLSYALLVLFLFASACEKSQNAWQGTWDTQDTQGGAYTITLGDDGQAGAVGSQNTSGTWREEDGKAYIVWDSGWKAILYMDEQGMMMKDAFPPDGDFGEYPYHTTEAKRL